MGERQRKGTGDPIGTETHRHSGETRPPFKPAAREPRTGPLPLPLERSGATAGQHMCLPMCLRLEPSALNSCSVSAALAELSHGQELVTLQPSPTWTQA